VKELEIFRVFPPFGVDHKKGDKKQGEKSNVINQELVMESEA
jgi:hypothetical protein